MCHVTLQQVIKYVASLDILPDWGASNASRLFPGVLVQ